MGQVFFNNQTLIEPGAASKVVVGIAPRANPLATGRVIVIGASEGSVPVASATGISWYTDKTGAKAVLRSGDALRAMGMIFHPSNQQRGAPFVGFIRSQVATKAEYDATSGKIVSKDYGLHVNNIKVQVENGTTSTSTKITVEFEGDTEVHDNLDLAITVQYVGSETSGLLEITAGDHIIGSAGDLASEIVEFDFDFALSSYNTVSKVVAAIDALADWDCTIFGLAPGGTGTLNSTILNTLAEGDGKAAALNLLAYPNISEYSLDTFSQYVDGTVETDGTKLTNTTEWNLLTGGTAVSQATADITAALTLAEEANAQLVWLDSETPADHALVTAHCLANQYWRESVYGGVSVATQAGAVTAAKAAAALINSPHASYVGHGIDDFAEDGSGVEAISPKFFAARVVGLIAGQPVQSPITRKSFNALGLQYEFTKAERESLIQAGVIVGRNMESLGLVINQGINTMQNNVSLWDTNANASPEISLNRSVGLFNKELEVAADRIFIGGTVGVGRATIIGFIEAHCKAKEAEGVLAQDDSDPDNILPAWENAVATREGDAWSGAVSIRLNNPFNHFLQTTTVSL